MDVTVLWNSILMSDVHRLTGFGFGPIQGGLFVREAVRSGAFARVVVAEVDAELVAAVQANRGCYSINIARHDGIHSEDISGVQMFNPLEPSGRDALVDAIAESTEICTCLPSVSAYGASGGGSVASMLACGLAEGKVSATAVYTAENNNHAAECLEAEVAAVLPNVPGRPVQYLNTVIGKMSRVVTDPSEVERLNLRSLAPGIRKAFLVEEFNRILATRITLPGFTRGLAAFEEESDLLPFEEAKLYGHNASHALLGYLANERGYRFMSEVAGDGALLALAREALIGEAGCALVAKYAGRHPLFTPAGWQAYADDLMERMLNPHLSDAVARVIRDPRRKLAWNDRLVGAMRLALEKGIAPRRFARGAAAALALVPGMTLDELWPEAEEPVKTRLKELILHEC
jgi:mannitol-1-phosphate 5-dehydrogenase